MGKIRKFVFRKVAPLSILLIFYIPFTVLGAEVASSQSSIKWILEKVVVPITVPLITFAGGIFSAWIGFYWKTGIHPFERIGRKQTKTPGTFAKEYETIRGSIDEIQVKQSNPDHDFATEPILEKRMQEYLRLADQFWSSEKISYRYRSSYYYALAAYVCQKMRKCSDAGRFYHFAGHGFRELGEYELAGMCYKWSGDLYREDQSKRLNALRAYRRARKAFSNVGDEHIVESIQNIENEVVEETKPCVEDLGWWTQKGFFRERNPY